MSFSMKLGALDGSVIVGDPSDLFPDNYEASLIEDEIAGYSAPVAGIDYSHPLETRVRDWHAVVSRERAIFVARNGHPFGVAHPVRKPVVTTAGESAEFFAASAFMPMC